MSDWSTDLAAAPRDGSPVDLQVTRANGDVFEMKRARWKPRTVPTEERPGDWWADGKVPLIVTKITAWRVTG